MTQYIFSNLSNNQVLAMNASSDILYFDLPISAASIGRTLNWTSYPNFTISGKKITLQVDIRELTKDNLIFSDGSLFLNGDNQPSTSSDDANNTLIGGDGNDWLYGFGGVDSIFGGGGDDTIKVATGAYIAQGIVDGGTGTDLVTFLTPVIPWARVTVNLQTNIAIQSNSSLAIINVEKVFGTNSNNSFVGGDLAHAAGSTEYSIAEVFRGYSGNDTITGASATAYFNTVADYANNSSTQVIIADLRSGIVSDGLGGTDTLVNVRTILGGAAADQLTGGGLTRAWNGLFLEVFRGNGGSDFINGNNAYSDGDDASSDRADYSTNSSSQAVNVNLSFGAASDGLGSTDFLMDIDQVYGGAGDDTLTGGASRDLFDGGIGNDVIDGGAASDTVRYQQATSGVIVNLGAGPITITGSAGTKTVAAGAADDGMSGIDTLISIENIDGSDYNDYLGGLDLPGIRSYLIGEGGDNTLVGGSGIGIATYTGTPASFGGISASLVANSIGIVTVQNKFGGTDTLINIKGLAGTHVDDTLTGDSGDNQLCGNGGNDKLDGCAGNDWVIYTADPSGVTVNLARGVAKDGWNGATGLLALGGTDTLLNIENIEGSDYNDTLTGSADANLIKGGLGNDVIDGGGGIDAAVYEGALASSTITKNQNGSYTISNSTDGVDTLTNIEFLQFSDQTFSLSSSGPTITSFATTSVGESILTSTPFYTVTATDPDANTTLSYSISGGADAALFNINTATGAVSFKASPNFEAPADNGANNVYDIIVQASDGSLSATQAVAISVTDVAESGPLDTTAPKLLSQIETGRLFYIVPGSDGQSIYGFIDQNLNVGTKSSFSGATFPGVGNSSSQAALLSDGNIAVVDANGGAVDVVILNPTGQVIDSFLNIGNVQSYDLESACLTVVGDTIVVGYGHWRESLTLIDYKTKSVSTPIIYSDNNGSWEIGATVHALPNGKFIVGWDDRPWDIAPGGYYFKIFDTWGTQIGASFKVDDSWPSYQHWPSIAVTADGEFVAAWMNAYVDGGSADIYLQKFNAETGAKLGARVTVTSNGDIKDLDPTLVSGGDGSLLLAWNRDGSIYLRAYDANLQPQGNEVFVSYGKVPDLVRTGDGFVLSWVSPNNELMTSKIQENTAAASGLDISSALSLGAVAQPAAFNFWGNPATLVYLPRALGAVVSTNGTSLTLSFGEALAASTASATSFSVTVGGQSVAVTEVAISDVTATLTLATPITKGAEVLVGYTDPVGDQSTGVLQDVAGNDVASFSTTAANSATASNSAPSITSTVAASTAENVSTSTPVYTATATDPDANTTLSYLISGGADAALFNINTATGAVSFKASPNFEAPADNGANNVYDIIVQASDGSLSATQAVAISVTDVAESGPLDTTAPKLLSQIETGRLFYIVPGSDGQSIYGFIDQNLNVGTKSSFSGATFPGVGNSSSQAALLSDGNIAVVDANGGAVDVVILNPTGQVIDSFLNIGNVQSYDLELACLTVVGDTIVVGYGHWRESLTLIDYKTKSVSTPIIYSDNNGSWEIGATVHALPNGKFIVGWDDRPWDIAPGGYYFKIFDTWGTQIGASFKVDDSWPSYQHWPSIAVTADGEFVAAWMNAYVDGGSADIYLQKFNAETGAKLGARVTVTSNGDIKDLDPTLVSGGDGSLLLAWNRDGSIFLRAYDANLQPQGNEVFVSYGKVPDLVRTGDGFVLSWVSPNNELMTSKIQENTAAASGLDISSALSLGAVAQPAAFNFWGNPATLVYLPRALGAVVSTNGTSLTLSFGEALAPTTVLGASFFVMANGQAVVVSDVAISGNTATLSLASQIALGASVVVAYEDTAGDQPENVLQDLAGNDVASFSVTAIRSGASSNSAPTITSAATASIAENVSNSTAVYTATATDPDANTTLIYSLSGGADVNLFKINATTGVVTFKTSPNFEAPADAGANNVYDIVVQASDGSLSATQAVTISVANVNEAPSITSGATATTAENVSTATAVYTVTATDPDANTTLTYSISGGADAALFNINTATGAATFKTSPNFEAPADNGANNVYDLIVQASDGSLSATQAVAITVTNVNEAPTITSSATATTPENVSTLTAVYRVIATDPDANATLTYSISDGVDASLFNINAMTGAVTFKSSPNFEAPADNGANNVYDIIVQASDGSLSATKAVAISVTNVNEAPSITSVTTATTLENVSTSTAFYSVTATDPDAGTTLSYGVFGVDAAFFNINTLTGAVTFKSSPNFEAPADNGGDNVYDIIVHASDGPLSATQAVVISVTNVNEAPTITSGATATTPENVSTSTVVYTAVATDPDANTTLSYSISGGADASLFNINASTGVVTFKSSPNFESSADAGADNVYDIVVQASDGSLSATKAVAISVTNVNEAPTITSGATATTPENVSTSTAVYTVAGTDPDANTMLSYSISGGADAALFNINASTGAVTFKASPNFEAPADNGANNVYDIIVQASNGSLSATQAVAISVTNVNEAPTITSGATATAPENVSTSTVVYTAVATDPDANTTLSYSISGGADAALFSINASTGAVTFKTSPNFEAPGDNGADNVYDIILQASDGSLSATEAVAITVTNVNDATTITSGATATTPENVSTSTAVYTVAGTDPDANTTLTYSISGGMDASLFNINTTTGAVTFKVSPNFEAPTDAGADNVYDITVRTSDGSLFADNEIQISVTDVLETKRDVDFNGDGKSDILLQNANDGTCYIWELNGTSQLVGNGYVGWTPGKDWVAKGTGDFNGDGKSDILLQNATDGTCYIWELNGTSKLVGNGYVGWTPGKDWVAKGTGDFNGDEKSDILLQNANDGSCYIWELNGTSQLVGNGYVGWTPGKDWVAKGTGDFNGDEKSDILLQNANDGACYIWELNGTSQLVGNGYVGWTPGKDWVAKGTGDFNGDGKSDILLQNANDGACYIWELNGTSQLVGNGYVGWTPGKDWGAKGTGDFNGDGKSDILLQNANDGACYIWELNGTSQLVGNGYVGWTPGTDWHAVA